MNESALKNLIRVGVVSSINPANGTAKVVFHEKNGLVSGDLPIIYRQTFRNKDYQMPDIDEQVVCLFLENGLEQGFILGAVYSSEDVPPSTDPNKRMIHFQDGTVIVYDRAAHKLTATVNGTAEITATHTTINGDVTINGTLTLSGINMNTHKHPESIGTITGAPQ